MNLSASGLAANRSGRRIFSNLSFTLSAGETLAVTDPNGAGKSTLLRLVAGLLEPAEGRIELNPSPDNSRGESVHYLGHLDALKPALSLTENLRFWQRLWRWGAGDIAPSLERVGIAHLASLPVRTFSAGQRRRAAIARLLLAPRSIWLLDEPTSSLDADGEAMLAGLVTEHVASGGIAIVATHRPLAITPRATLTLRASGAA
jgi:heme exporter protein A